TFALVGEVHPGTQRVTPRVEAGVDGYLDEVVLSDDPEDPGGRGPIGRAIQSLEMKVANDVLSDPDFAPWREYARKYGYRSLAAIPIVYEETLYGVLAVYADRADAFADAEREVVGQVGEIVGHAIASVERKHALMSDDVVEVEFRVPDLLGSLGITLPSDGRISFERVLPTGDGSYLEYGTASDDATDALRSLVDRLSYGESVTFLGREFDDVRFEIRLNESPVLSAIAAHGGNVERATIEDGDYHMTIQLPPGVAVRNVMDVVRSTFPAVEMVTRRQVQRSDESRGRLHRELTEELTERQRAALEAAYFLGFFEWPRENAGHDVADSLDVSPPTFHQHLRRAEKKLLEVLFSDERADRRGSAT
ncbi:MAG: bacterio-opsin activator domain-containing protein, partial [Salinigranum sp.]